MPEDFDESMENSFEGHPEGECKRNFLDKLNDSLDLLDFEFRRQKKLADNEIKKNERE